MAEGLSFALQWVCSHQQDPAVPSGGALTTSHRVHPAVPPLPPTPRTEESGKNRQVLLGIILPLNHVRGSKTQGNIIREVMSKFYFNCEKLII